MIKRFLPYVYAALLMATFWLKPDGKGIESPGIVALELSSIETIANVIIGGWSADGLAAAKRLQAQDDIWIPVYAASLALGCYLAGGKWGRRLMYGSMIAGVCDFIENRAINRMLDGESGQPWPAVSAVFAFIKFAIVIAAIVYTLKAGFRWLRSLRAAA